MTWRKLPAVPLHVFKPLRRLLPPSGPAYELFDAAVLTFVLGFIGYVITPASPTAQDALVILKYVREEALGWTIAAASLFAIVASYLPQGYRAGYVVLITASGTMSLYFLIGWCLDVSNVRAILSSVLYGYIARRLIRDAP